MPKMLEFTACGWFSSYVIIAILADENTKSLLSTFVASRPAVARFTLLLAIGWEPSSSSLLLSLLLFGYNSE